MNITIATLDVIKDDILELSYTTVDGKVLRHRMRYDRKNGVFVPVDPPQ